MDVNSYQFQKIPLKKYPEILAVLSEVQKKTKLVSETGSIDQILQNLPLIIQSAYPEIVSLINITTNIPKETIEEWGLDDLVMAVEKLVEVNKLSFVYERIKKVISGNQNPLPAGQ